MRKSEREFVQAMQFTTWIALPATALLGHVAPRAAQAIAAAGVATIGIAHGANDDVILSALLPAFPGGRTGISMFYGLTTLGAGLAAWCQPRAAARTLSLLTWYHFGTGDDAFSAQASSRPRSVSSAFVRGAIPLFAQSPGKQLPVNAAVALFAVAALMRRDAAGALDFAIPAAVVSRTSSPLGFALYFGLWHAPRHLALVLARMESGSIRERAKRFLHESARNTAMALGVGAIVLSRTKPQNRHRAFVALTLGITVPHECAVRYARYREALSDE